MLDPVARKRRLEQDYRDLLLLRGPVIDFEAFDPPAPERYILKYKLKSIMAAIGNNAKYSPPGFVHKINLVLTNRYPEVLTRDEVGFISDPIFHPNVYEKGPICIADYTSGEALARFVLRIARMIQFVPGYINEGSAANPAAVPFFVANKKYFPVDRTPLPELDRFIPGPVQKTFVPGPVRQ